MKPKLLPSLILLGILCTSVASFGQLSGIKTIPGDYPSIANAVSTLNASGVGAGGVTFNIAANYSETITSTISLTATGTVANPIVFQKDPGTSGANPLVISHTGNTTPSSLLQDGIWRLQGVQYVTISKIDLQDNPANTTNPSTMEYGYGLYKASTAAGCQHITIQNCVITLNAINNASGAGPMVDGSTGIIVMNATATAATTALTPVSANGTNSNNKFYGNTIQSCNTGIAIIGYVAPSPFTLADANNDVGGNSSATGNTIINYGGAAGATNPAVGIRTLAQYGINISYNNINNNTGAGSNHVNIVRGIYNNTALSAAATISYNSITLNGGGTTHAVTAIENTAGSTPAGNSINIVSNSIVNSAYATASTGAFTAILNSGAPASLQINNNVISGNSSSASTTGAFYGINNSGAATATNINANSFTNNSIGASSGVFAAFNNTAATGSLSVANNIVNNNTSNATAGLFFTVANSGAIAGNININNNSIGSGLLNAINFAVANSGAQVFINNAAGAATATLSITNNNFQGINYASAGSGSNTYISNTAATLSQNISNNTFTNLTAGITGNVTFISNSVVVAASGTQTVRNNAIVTGFTKTGAGGTVTLFTSAASSIAGAVIDHSNNNFSNITVSGTTIIAGWVNTDGGAGNRTITNNTFSNWSAGTGAVTAISSNITGNSNATSRNNINGISSGGNITCIGSAAGNDNINNNDINTIISTAGTNATVYGILISGGTTKNIYQNSINNFRANSITTGTVRGILVSGGSTVNVYQNQVFSLQANAFTTGTLSGIAFSSGTTVTANANKVYDLYSTNNAITTGTISGMQVSGTINNSTYIFSNNIIGNLRATAASAALPVIGINCIHAGNPSTVSMYYNSVYLNANSTGTNFGSSAVSHTANANSALGVLLMANNVFINTSTANGTGLTSVIRRSATTLANYHTSSNNNLLYSGNPGSNTLLYYDGTNADQLLSSFKSRVTPRETVTVTDDMISSNKFLSLDATSSDFLKPDATKSSFLESGGLNIAGITTDYLAIIRQGNAGYTGSGTAPDLGALEINGTRLLPLSGSYYVGTGQQFTSLTRTGGLFALVNNAGLKGNVVVYVTSDLSEDGANALYQWAEQGVGNYSLTIQPNTASLKVISGDVAAGMIRFNGVSRVSIDGIFNGNGQFLNFRNTNASLTTGSAFSFTNGASNNTINSVIMEAATNATTGVAFFGTTTGAGNSNNTIINSDIDASLNGITGLTGIYSGGTAGNENSNNTVTNCRVFDFRDRGIDVATTGSTGWSMTQNSIYNGSISGALNYAASSLLHGIRILGGSGYTVTGNFIGGSTTASGGPFALYTSTGNLSVYGILLTTTGATPASNIKGNTINNIDVNAVPTAASSNVFTGIETNGSGINIGGTLAGEGNMIGSNTSNGSIDFTTTTTTTTFTSNIRGINCNSTSGLIAGNQVGGVNITNVGAAPAASTFTGIQVNNASTTQVINNIIGSTGAGAASNSIQVVATSIANRTVINGIVLTALVTNNISVDGNIIRNCSFLNSGVTTISAGGFVGISSAATGTATVAITNNSILDNNVINYSTGLFNGINTTGAATTLNITGNTLAGNLTQSATGLYNAVLNSGAVTGTININNNNIGTAASPAIAFNAVNSGNQVFLNNTGGNAAATIAINNNNFQGINYIVAGTGNNTFISNTASTITQSINNNSFTNLLLNTAGSVTFMSGGAVPAAATRTVNGNNIVTGFNKTAAGGTLTLYSSTASSGAGSIISNNNNNFSNITVKGNTAIAGWVNTDAGSGTKTIQGNTFSNWTGGSANINVMDINITGSGNATTGNTINNISGAGNITGIVTAAGNDNIYANTISNISSTGTGATLVNGITINAGITKNIYQNTITGIRADYSNLGGNVVNSLSSNGIWVNGGTTVNVYQNIISAITGDAINAGTVNGIVVSGGTTVNITKNKIFNITSNSTAINAGGLSGIILFPGAGNVTNIVNNYIGDIRTPFSPNTDSYRGITINNTNASNVNVYYNTIYLNGTSTGNNFGSTGIYHASSATANIGQLDLRNNIIINTSVPMGTGQTVVKRQYAVPMNNYAATSNNNLFYAGTPSANRLMYNDFTNSDQTLAAFQARLVNRDGLSVTEDLATKIISFNTASTNYLHIDPTKCNRAESGGTAIAGTTNDYDNDTRFGNGGYTGNGTAPDIGADEFNGITYPKAVLSGSTTICDGGSASITLTVTGSGTISGTLSDGTVFSGTAPTINVNVSPAVTTNYTIATLTNGSCPAETSDKTGSALVTINVRPTGSISGSQTICAGNAATLTLTVSGSGTLSGTLSNGTAFSGTAPTIIVNVSPVATTIYTIATLTNGTCTAIAADKTGSATVTVTSPSNATITYSGSPYCSSGGTATVTLTGTAGGTFTAPAGVSINSSNGAINLGASTTGTYTITYTVPSAGGCAPFVTNTGIAIATPGTWTGTVNTDWNNSGNWLCGAIPYSTINASIAGGLTNYPLLSSSSGAVNNISIATGASLNVSNATLEIYGNITNSGLFITHLGTIEMAGSAVQTIPAATFQNNTLYALVINNSSVGGVSLGGQLDILESLTFKGTGSTFKTNDVLTLKSSALRTAWVGNTTGNSITEKVTVERYLWARKGWRLLSVPTNSTQTILQAWQEGCSTNANCMEGYGTILSGSAGIAGGFDAATATPSMKYYEPATARFVGVANTNATAIKNNTGYFVFVRGDRSATTISSPVTSAILRTKGPLYTGDQPALTVPAKKFASIGNPYAAPLDMRNIQKTGIKNFFYVWDPLLAGSLGYGAYQTFSDNGSGNYVVTPGGGSYGPAGTVSNYIQSGLAFFVESTVGGGSITIKESAKGWGSSLVARNPGEPLAELRTNLLGVNTDGSTYVADGILVNYDDQFSNIIDDNDGLKSLNTSENIAVKTTANLLVVERKHTITDKDTIYLNIANMRQQAYRLEVKTALLYQPGIAGMVVDNYLQTSSPVNIDGTTVVNFSITSAAASYAANRFRIVFNKLSVLPVTITTLQASYRQQKVNLTWKVENELNVKSYEVEKSANGNSFTFLTSKDATSNGSNSKIYEVTDPQPASGLNYYRVKSVDRNGQFAYSQIVKVQAGGIAKPNISIFPNPIEAGLINVRLVDEQEGKYKIRILNATGQAVLLKEFVQGQGSSVQTIQLDESTASGMYHVEITRPSMEKTTIDVIKW